jgi:hypothetical protein
VSGNEEKNVMSEAHSHEGPCDHDHDHEVDLLRVWVEGSELNLVVNPDAIEDVELWGAVLATAVHHIAGSLHKNGGPAPEETLARIQKAFTAELKSPPEAPAAPATGSQSAPNPKNG